MRNFETLTEALADLKSRGYVNDFNLHPDWIECPPLGVKLKPAAFHIDEYYRFEGMTDPDDSSILFAISSSDGVKGVLVDAYGTYSESLSPLMLQKLRVDRQTNQ
jgi:hypothetical protein